MSPGRLRKGPMSPVDLKGLPWAYLSGTCVCIYIYIYMYIYIYVYIYIYIYMCVCVLYVCVCKHRVNSGELSFQGRGP